MILDWLRETGYYCPSPEIIKSAQYFGLTKKHDSFSALKGIVHPLRRVLALNLSRPNVLQGLA